jgi:hypothetical protein
MYPIAPGPIALAARAKYALPKLDSTCFQQLHADGQVQGTQVQDGPHPHVPSPQAHASGAQAHPAQQLFFSFFCSIIVSPFERIARSSTNADAPERKILQSARGIRILFPYLPGNAYWVSSPVRAGLLAVGIAVSAAARNEEKVHGVGQSGQSTPPPVSQPNN